MEMTGAAEKDDVAFTQLLDEFSGECPWQSQLVASRKDSRMTVVFSGYNTCS